MFSIPNCNCYSLSQEQSFLYTVPLAHSASHFLLWFIYNFTHSLFTQHLSSASFEWFMKEEGLRGPKRPELTLKMLKKGLKKAWFDLGKGFLKLAWIDLKKSLNWPENSLKWPKQAWKRLELTWRKAWKRPERGLKRLERDLKKPERGRNEPELTWKSLNWPEKSLNWLENSLNWPKKSLNWPKKGLNWPKKGLKWLKNGLNWPEKSLNWSEKGLNWSEKGLNEPKQAWRGLNWFDKASNDLGRPALPAPALSSLPLSLSLTLWSFNLASSLLPFLHWPFCDEIVCGSERRRHRQSCCCRHFPPSSTQQHVVTLFLSAISMPISVDFYFCYKNPVSSSFQEKLMVFRTFNFIKNLKCNFHCSKCFLKQKWVNWQLILPLVYKISLFTFSSVFQVIKISLALLIHFFFFLISRHCSTCFSRQEYDFSETVNFFYFFLLEKRDINITRISNPGEYNFFGTVIFSS